MVGKTLGLQFKLEKHLKNADVERVRDYLSHIVIEWPNLEKCPIDFALLKRAMAFVRLTFDFNPKAKTVKYVFIRKSVAATA